MAISLDSMDHRLLDQLQTDARTPIAELAEIAGTSTASVNRRLKRMRDAGVIRQEIAVIDPACTTRPMRFIISVEIERESLDKLDTFRRRARKDPQIQQCYCVTGEADFILIVTARDMADFEAFTHRFFFEDQNVLRYKTNVVITNDKLSLSVPFDPD